MKLKMIITSLLYASNAMAYTLGSETVLAIGNARVLIKPYYEENGTQLPIFLDYKLVRKAPAMNSLCTAFTGVPADQIKSVGVDIKIKDPGMLFDPSNGSFAPLPMPNKSYNGVEAITCQSDQYPIVPLGGVTTYLPNGSMRVDQPTLTFKGIEYPISLDMDFYAANFCNMLGYSNVEGTEFSYERRNPGIIAIEPKISTYDALEIDPKIVESKDTPFLVVDSITCSK